MAPGETTQDAVELLTAEHQVVDGLFARIESASGTDKDEAVGNVTRELSIHAAIEEQVVYPVMRRSLPDGNAKEKAIAEHQTVKETLAEIERSDPSAERDHKPGSPSSEGPGTEVWVDWQLCPTSATETVEIAPPAPVGDRSLSWRSRSERGGGGCVALPVGRVRSVG